VILKAESDMSNYTSAPVKLGWSLESRVPTLTVGESLTTTWYAKTRVKVAIDKDHAPTAVTGSVSWVTTFEGYGMVALTSHRLVGIIYDGASMVGEISWTNGAGVVLWSLPFSRCSSVEIVPLGDADGVTLVSAKPAGRATLSGFHSATPHGGAFPIVTAAQVSSLIENSRARVWSRLSDAKTNDGS
jgi:hypothetical protein